MMTHFTPGTKPSLLLRFCIRFSGSFSVRRGRFHACNKLEICTNNANNASKTSGLAPSASLRPLCFYICCWKCLSPDFHCGVMSSSVVAGCIFSPSWDLFFFFFFSRLNDILMISFNANPGPGFELWSNGSWLAGVLPPTH